MKFKRKLRGKRQEGPNPGLERTNLPEERLWVGTNVTCFRNRLECLNLVAGGEDEVGRLREEHVPYNMG